MLNSPNYQEPFLQHCCDRATEAFHDGHESGIAACIVKDGALVAVGANTVFDDRDATKHAEINAMANAGQKLATSDLSGCILYSSLQPCEMCLAAARFAGIDEIYYAAEKANVASKYFMFPDLEITDFLRASRDVFAIRGGMRQAQVIHLYGDGDA